MAEVAKLMMDAGLVVMTAFISTFKQERDMVRNLTVEENFVEIFVDTPHEVCEKRDAKGLYKKALLGQTPNMTGIDSPYEQPVNPDYMVLLYTDIEFTVSQLSRRVTKRKSQEAVLYLCNRLNGSLLHLVI